MPPKEPVKDAENSTKVLRVGMLNFSVRQCVLAHKDPSQFRMLAELLETEAAELLNEGAIFRLYLMNFPFNYENSALKMINCV